MHGHDDDGQPSRDAPCFGLVLALVTRGLAISEYPEMVRVSGIAERYGFGSVWLCDHFLTLSADDHVQQRGAVSAEVHRQEATPPASMPLLEAWTALSALARDTTNLRLGTSVLCNSYRHPSVLAKMAATLDVISEGRLDLGLGAGWFQHEFEAYGIPFPPVGDRVAALGEALEVITAIWTQLNPVYSGRFYTLDGAICNPPPLQQPHPPLWVGGEGDRIHRIAARFAQGINIRFWPPEQVQRRRAFLTQACTAVGRDPDTLRLSLTAVLAPTRSAAQEAEVREQFSSIPNSGLIVGPADRCIERIDEYYKSGVDTFLFAIPDVGRSDFIHTVGQKVIPAFR
ncbi:Phthiodiolone/phenolphthiodiolone dimycocerosates ketoreductase [Mycobacterium basiliense]|uniref:Phthiodiolone/phenolphthiodiolone dimycocerosates ketoreductase n=1 Tax=Mycobacterium basiliense TaxID=2094119 RepID=A0A447GF78_9MYCO|nr:LLM class flavin-dependent oxidoreductase [Mycobacterium basiliense]VDM89160.1 Phthiodiolone/phenolphthiodiolone dimycocerosates ketoreductase [Mycobacterium basiliense]